MKTHFLCHKFFLQKTNTIWF